MRAIAIAAVAFALVAATSAQDVGLVTRARTTLQVYDGGQRIGMIDADTGRLTVAEGHTQAEVLKLLVANMRRQSDTALAQLDRRRAELDECIAGWKRSSDALAIAAGKR
jgi:hypothetical protein